MRMQIEIEATSELDSKQTNKYIRGLNVVVFYSNKEQNNIVILFTS